MMNYFLTTLFAFQILTAQAATYIPTGVIEFTAKGFPTFITIKGNGEGIEGVMQIEESLLKSATLNFPLKTLKTGMDLRDEHMHGKYLETNKYPVATLTLDSFTLKETGETEGELKLHNVVKKIKIQYETQGENPLIVKASFTILLEDFSIDIPSFQGITVAKDIKLTIQLKATKK